MDVKIRKIISEEVSKIVKESYLKEDGENSIQGVEAEISTALSFMQDISGSLNKLNTQKELSSTTPEVDNHIDNAIIHMKQAVESYLKTLMPDIKSKVIGRIGEINIEK